MADFLFDIGKVLLDFHFDDSIRTLIPSDHPDPTSAIHALLAKKDDFEAGQISVDDFTQWGLKALQSSASEEAFHRAWQNIFTPNLPMWNLVHRLMQAQHRLILFSNINGIHAPWVFENYPEFAQFHGAVLSHEVGAIKPQPAIYEFAIREYKLIPQHTFYIDDLPANIAMGQQFGFITHLYRLSDHAAFEEWLFKQLAS